ncbi:MAG: right-handed parallel beta-helix repeat-containing protein [Ignavibacteriales bacterium]|nr:right-handed parallel beta-helix repeat-containing protein [Ignavibacteriales bacterium]
MKPKIFLPLLLSFLILNSSLLISTVRYVSPTGSSTPPYTSWETAADSIMECINICVFGDTVYVANGVYEEQVVMIPGLSLIGAGMDSCIVDTKILATNTSFRSIVAADNCVLEGFKIIVANNTELGGGIGGTAFNTIIKNNRITSGKYGIYLGSAPIIYMNTIDKISSGIYLFNSNGIARQNTIFTDPNSQSAIIAGIRIETFNDNYYPIIDSNYIVTYARAYGIQKSFGSNPTITNNTIVLNYSPTGIFLSYSDSAKVFDNLILGSGAQGIYNAATQFLQLVNNYLTGNIGDLVTIGSNDLVKNNSVANGNRGFEETGNENLIFQYNNAWNNSLNNYEFNVDSTNLEVDPMVMNDDSIEGDLDFHLQKYSPLIDAGDPNILDKDSTRSDIGLYGGPFGESYTYFDLAPHTPVNLNATLDSLTVGITWNKNTEADFNHYNVYRDTTKNFQIDSTNLFVSTPVTNLIDILPDYVPSIYYKITAVDNQDNESQPSEEVGFILTSITDYQQTISDYRLYQNYPNPFNPSTKISYRLKERGYVKLYVYDIKGELISVLVNQTQEAGFYEVDFVGNGLPTVPNNSNLSSGIYIYQIMVRSENNIPMFTDMKKMLLIK